MINLKRTITVRKGVKSYGEEISWLNDIMLE